MREETNPIVAVALAVAVVAVFMLVGWLSHVDSDDAQ